MTANLAVKADNGAPAGRPQVQRRIPLAELASRGSSVASPALGRVMPAAASAGSVPVAAFQSFSSK
ncbi:FxSxx-COOH cyclophane-containing RiPP peptide [Streptomyces sp. NPDC088354]|uniref:FxSxx-COOH cyclophane-containing RiPP peptide n=1 Tax=unclassified Streptomyces TaxID=2593676 RepID=UPI0029BB14EE|nr:FxSxx-COOH cyclophane-containing RiPP peptide [Streptomyces sp. MI02-7b]MDX3073165.1 FxSxx-COOH protein [Streptomyces sp. MI02-7b]